MQASTVLFRFAAVVASAVTLCSAAANNARLNAIVNAASYQTGPIAPGEMVSLFGQGLGPAEGVQPTVTLNSGLPTELANVQVTFDGKPAPLLYVQDSLINAVVPWSLRVDVGLGPFGGTTTEICVVYIKAMSNCLERSVNNVAPGVFTADGVHAVALNQDGSLNSVKNPAKSGSTVSIFATGLGPISPGQPDGSIVKSPLPMNLVQWNVGYLSGTLQTGSFFTQIEVTDQGPVLFEPAGVSQISFKAGWNVLQLGGRNQYANVFSPTFQIWIAP
ncbi:MAG TPA: hypothetical protein VKT49_04055 [Bryobacteraceae bacterium]|nr:hypothetical protein [Bryobacteraceae bacterium]